MQKILFQEHKENSVEVVLEINVHMVIFQYDGCSFINIQKEKLIPNQQEDSYVIQSKKSWIKKTI